jgi:hypothetical protein
MCYVDFLQQTAIVFQLSIFSSVVLSEVCGVLFELYIYVAYNIDPFLYSEVK